MSMVVCRWSGTLRVVRGQSLQISYNVGGLGGVSSDRVCGRSGWVLGGVHDNTLCIDPRLTRRVRNSEN